MAVPNNSFAFVSCFILLVIFGCVSAAPAPTSSPAKIFSGYFSNLVSKLIKWLKLKATTKTAMSGGRPVMKFEGGYNVETVFDGSKLGIEPYWVEMLPNGGDLLILDSANSNIYKISASLSLYSRPKLVAGSAEGYSGHVDGKHREARMNHPKGIAVDDRGNIYVADTHNLAIRKISDTCVTTIAGGKWGRGGAHLEGSSEDLKFSDDFDVVYIGSSCSLLVIDRGNRAIREIQLHFDDCAYQYGNGFPIGIAVLIGAGFLGYLLALLQCRLVANRLTVASQSGLIKISSAASLHNKPLKSVRPPLIPTKDELKQQEEGFFGSVGKLLVNTGTSTLEILGGVFPGFIKKAPTSQYTDPQQQKHSSAWPVQESFVIPDEDEPPSIETRTPTPRKTYPFMSKDAEKMHQLRQSRAFYNGWDGDLQQQKKQHHHKYHSSTPHTYYEKTSEIVFGAVQEQDGKLESVVIKPENYEDSVFNHHNIRS